LELKNMTRSDLDVETHRPFNQITVRAGETAFIKGNISSATTVLVRDVEGNCRGLSLRGPLRNDVWWHRKNMSLPVKGPGVTYGATIYKEHLMIDIIKSNSHIVVLPPALQIIIPLQPCDQISRNDECVDFMDGSRLCTKFAKERDR
jgi:hypothetical protein